MTKLVKSTLLAFSALLFWGQFAVAQEDPYATINRLMEECRQRTEYHARNAINSYRQQTGDYRTPDAQVMAYLVQLSKRQNPDFYRRLRQREQAFQAQQQAYVQNANQALDNSFNSYMRRSNINYQSHRRYVREGIWERGNYTNSNGTTYQLPNYQPNTMYRANDGGTIVQDAYGNYWHYDAYGYRTPMQYRNQ